MGEWATEEFTVPQPMAKIQRNVSTPKFELLI